MLPFDPNFTSWGPFINHETFIVQPVTQADLITACVVLVITAGFAVSAAYFGYKQTKRSRYPLKSAYIWMLWAEWASSITIAFICMGYLVRVIRPSFYLFFGILLLWTIQTQCLLQIIINRIRIILHDRKEGRRLMLIILALMSLINISVFVIWMPARMQISIRWIHINDIWDRMEKVLYLIMDGYLNYYFIKTVKVNLVENGLHKYNHLVRFNQCIIVASLLMDVLIIGAMSIPNGFVYAIFHPLAYLVKLNIEMSMARLIKKIALGSNNPHGHAAFRSYTSTSDVEKTNTTGGRLSTWVEKQRTSIKTFFNGEDKNSPPPPGTIKRTAEFTVSSRPTTDIEMKPRDHTEDKQTRVHVTHSERATPVPSKTESHTRVNREGREVKDYTSDEEVLIKPKPVQTRTRRSLDSSDTS